MIDWPKVVRDLERENKELKKRLEQRKWVFLTDEEIDEIQYSKHKVDYELFDEGEYGFQINIYPENFARAIEAKLKEKNHIANVGKMIGGNDADRVE